MREPSSFRYRPQTKRTEGDDIELVIALGLVLIMGLNGEKESKVPFMKMKNGDIYQPIFTDMPEFFKFCRDGQFRAAVIPYAKLNNVILKQAKCVIMNPFGVRLILNKGQF